MILHRLRAALAIASTLLGLWLCAVWAQSYARGDSLCYLPLAPARFRPHAIAGLVLTRPAFDVAAYARAMPGGWGQSIAGFGLAGHATASGPPVDFLLCPFWFPFLLCAMPPTLWSRARRRNHPNGHAFPVDPTSTAKSSNRRPPDPLPHSICN